MAALVLAWHLPAVRADIPGGWPWKINHLAYPTLGCPEIVKRGEAFTLEFDCYGRGEGGAQPVGVTGWEVTLVSSNDRWPTRVSCQVESATRGVSERWPGDSTTDSWYGSGPWAGKEVWKVAARVPAGSRPDLYDLWVTAVMADSVIDSQPHAVQVVAEYKTSYNFIQMTDFHVNDPRGPSVFLDIPVPHPDSAEFEDDRYNLKAVDDVNRINPDFVVMTGDTVFGVPFFVEYPYESTGITDMTGTAPDWNGEYNKVYEQLLRLEVPVMCIPGNHDSYNLQTIAGAPLDGHARQDGAELWPTVLGPRYFGWDYGTKCHFTCFWAYDKDPTARAFSNWSLILPEAQLPPFDGGGGQVRQWAVDHWEAQMQWLEGDLMGAQGNFAMLAMAAHNPFFGTYSDSDSFTDHQSRDRLRALSRTYGVTLALSGHTHEDNVFVDTTGGAHVTHLNTTSTTFNTIEYPGFRRVFIENGALGGYNYRSAFYSYPTYRDTIIKKHASAADAFQALQYLDTPSVSGGFNTDNPDATFKEFSCSNYLTGGDPPVVLDNTVVDFVMSDLGDPAHYRIDNGTLIDRWNPEGGHVTFRVRVDAIPPGGEVVTRVRALDIVSVTPASARRGGTLVVEIEGRGTSFLQGVSEARFSGEGITVNWTDVADGTHASASITVSGEAPLGARDVNVVTGGEVPFLLAGAFTIEPLVPVPHLSINVGQVRAGASFKFSVALDSDIGEAFDFYILVDTLYGTYTLRLDGGLSRGITPLYRNVPGFRAPFEVTVVPNAIVPIIMGGDDVTFYTAAIAAGRVPPVARLADLSPDTPNVIMMDTKTITVAP
jgi:3',5'-cyclic AMP phosphodiesterase CpdA